MAKFLSKIPSLAGAGANLYGLLVRNGQLWNAATPGFEDPLAADLNAYAIALAEAGGSTGVFVGVTPVGVAAGPLGVVVCQRAGASPAWSDSTVAADVGAWDGAAWRSSGDAVAAAVLDKGGYTLLNPPPTALEIVQTMDSVSQKLQRLDTPVSQAGLSAAAAKAVAAAVNALTADGQTLTQALATILATTAGKCRGAEANRPVFTSVDGSADRVAATTDLFGNRTGVTCTPPGPTAGVPQ